MTTIQKKPNIGQTNPIAHLTPEDIEQIAKELDAIRQSVVDTRGESDARYIRKVIRTQRQIELGSRVVLLASIFPPAWLVGTAGLSIAKILENMEIGHNILHGQWDWMRDPKIHSTTWEWDSATPAAQWKHAHNELHHNFTNVIGKDNDLGYGIMRVDEDQTWHPMHLGQPLWNFVNALFFEYGIAAYDLELRGAVARGKTKDPEFVETFEKRSIDGETKAEWYIRQMLGSANISGSKLMHIMTGNLSHQIEHHLFPDLPSNRYGEIAPQVQDLFQRYGLDYCARPLPQQVYSAWHKVVRLSLPNGWLEQTNARNLPGQLKRLYQMSTGGAKVRRALQARITQESRRLKVAA
jgi:fatty acid desaturase